MSSLGNGLPHRTADCAVRLMQTVEQSAVQIARKQLDHARRPLIEFVRASFYRRDLRGHAKRRLLFASALRCRLHLRHLARGEDPLQGLLVEHGNAQALGLGELGTRLGARYQAARLF